MAVAGALARGLGIKLLTKPKDVQKVAKKAQKRSHEKYTPRYLANWFA